MSIFTELQRRKVLRVATAYLVVGWLLTEVLTTILPALGAPGWTAKAVILGFAFGFVPAVVLSWIYELTPNGIRKELSVDGDSARQSIPVGNFDYLAIVGVVVAILFIAVISASQTTEESDTEFFASVGKESIAVLPFVNMSDEKNNDYFSDGLTETLLHMLAQIPDLNVAARTSSFAFKGKNMDIRQIADALQVAHVLEGSVQQSGNRVRITAQLIRASDGYHVWSENFDRDNEDIFGIQDEIASKVGRALSASLLGDDGSAQLAGVGTNDADAYDLYLQALKHNTTFSYGGLEAAEELLKGALLIDSDFLNAKTELASNYLHQLETGSMNREDALASALGIAGQVLQASPDDVGAQAIRVYAQAVQQSAVGKFGSVDDSIDELEALVASNPREYSVRLLLSKMLKGTRRSEEALVLQRESLQSDPYNARVHFEIGSLHLQLGQFEEARAALQASLDIEPRQPNAYLNLGIIALKSGDGVAYLQQSLKAMEVDPRDHEIPGIIAAFLYQLNLTEEADDFRERVVTIAPTSPIAYRLELLRAMSVGDKDAGLIAARRAIEDGIEDRQFAFAGAVQYLLRAAVDSATVAVEIAYLERLWPGILDVDAEAIRYMNVQQVAFDIWVQTLPREELLRRIDKILQVGASLGIDMMQIPTAKLAVLAMQGKVDEAINIALSDIFSSTVLANQGWRARFSQPQYAEMVADPRINAALQAWETEEVQMREEVRNYLLDLSTAS